MPTAKLQVNGRTSEIAVRKLHLLHPLSAAESDILLNAAFQEVQLGPERDVARDGEDIQFCSVLLQGMVFRYKTLLDGSRQIGSFHIPGDFFDLQSLLTSPMDHSVATATPCRVALYRHDVMHKIVGEYPNIAKALWKEILSDAAMGRQRIISLGRRSAYERLAHLFCETMVRMQAVGLADGKSLSFPVTQIKLADAMGLSAVHVNRTLQELRADELISTAGNIVTIHDWERLQMIAEFNPDYLQLGNSGSSN